MATLGGLRFVIPHLTRTFLFAVRRKKERIAGWGVWGGGGKEKKPVELIFEAVHFMLFVKRQGNGNVPSQSPK